MVLPNKDEEDWWLPFISAPLAIDLHRRGAENAEMAQRKRDQEVSGDAGA